MFRRSLLVAGLLLCSAGAAFSQAAFPSKPITMIVPFPPGGNVDFAARVLATRFGETLKQSVVVENVPGAGGVIGVSKAVAAPADGYTLLVGVDSAISIAKFVTPTAVRYDSLRDLAPIGIINAAPMIILAKPALPADNVADLIKLARAQPGKLSYATSGVGTVLHLAMERVKAQAGIDLVHVPYKGGTALVAGVLTGQVPVGWSGIPNVAPHIRAGKLRVYAISTASRSALLAEVPTVAELGFPGFDIATVIGLQAPAGTPREIVARLQAATAKALRDQDTAERMHNLGMELMENGTEHYARFLKDDLERYAMAVKAAGMKND